MNHKHSMAGLNVLITRPGEQGKNLEGLIADAGGRPISLPLIKIDPITDAASVRIIQDFIKDLDKYDIAIFISINAAKFGSQWIEKYWPKIPTRLTIVAVGPTTGAALGNLATEIQTCKTGVQSEDILALPVLREVAGLRVALFRGRGGRELLAKTLRARGALVDYVETYERSTTEYEPGHVMRTLIDEQVNAISVTSGQILDCLCQLVDIKANDIRLIPLLVPSQRIRQKAIDAGFLTVIDCAGANDAAILAGLESVNRQRDPRQ